MRIVLYSGGDNKQNEKLDRELIKMVGKKTIRMVYVPVTNNEHEKYFEEFKAYYRKYGVTEFEYMALNDRNSEAKLRKVFSSDVIYLSGGNTYEFLLNLKKSGLARRFKSYISRGGILAGQSAGAILMTPHIGLAAIPSIDCDENEVGLNDLKSMGLVDFEFSPHYEYMKKGDRELKEYSAQKNYPIYSCPDGAGLVISGKRVRFVGKVIRFHNGQKEIVRQKWKKINPGVTLQ